MDFNITTWMKEYINRLTALFGTRLVFVGLQGSYGRGEATENSDIDVVVILDQVTPDDLKAYSAMLDLLPYREKVCGFISGRQELLHWERSDLFQFYHDTTPVFNHIDFLLSLIGREDIRRAIRMGACNIYHMCGHNMVHQKNEEILKGLYKTAAFIVQAVYYDQTGTYIKRKDQLLPVLRPEEQKILQVSITLKQQPDAGKTDFESFSQLLFNWAAKLIGDYRFED